MSKRISEETLEESNLWICTDPDTGQWAQQLGTYKFMVYERSADQLETYDLKGYTIKELEGVIEGYYDGFHEVTRHYPDAWPLIVAEIMSEKRLSNHVVA